MSGRRAYGLVLAFVWLVGSGLSAPQVLAESRPPKQPLIEQLDQAELYRVLTETDLDAANARRYYEAFKKRTSRDTPIWGMRLTQLECWMEEFEPFSWEAVYAKAEQGLKQAEQLHDRYAEADLLGCAGNALLYLGDTPRAEQLLERALKIAKELNEPLLIAQTLKTQGDMYSYIGRQGDSLQALEASLQIYEQRGLKRDALYLIGTIANVYRRIGQLRQAREYYQQAQSAYQALGDTAMLAMMENEIGQVLADEDRVPDAISAYLRARALYKQVGSNGERVISSNLAPAYCRIGDYQKALDEVAYGRQFFTDSGDQPGLNILLLSEAEALTGLGRYGEALAKTDQLLANPLANQTGWLMAHTLETRAKALSGLGRSEQAYRTYEQFITQQLANDEQQKNRESLNLAVRYDKERKQRANAALVTEALLRDETVKTLRSRRAWQTLALAFGAVMLGGLLWLLYLQIRRSRRLQSLAMVDELTGIANRRQMMTRAQMALALARRRQRTLSLLVFDLDHFKRVNDRHGHPAGDAVLKQIAELGQASLRRNDTLGRCGGEEFWVLLPGAPLAFALEVAERLRANVAQARFTALPDGEGITLSIGVAEWRSSDKDLAQLLARADAALYRAKQAGRNRIEPEAPE